jgi:hypothetical protein
MEKATIMADRPVLVRKKSMAQAVEITSIESALTFDDMVNDPCFYFSSERFSPDQLCSVADALSESGMLLERQPRWAVVELARSALQASVL